MSTQVGWKPSVIDDLHAVKIIVPVDDEDRENEGNLICSKGFNLVHGSDSAKSAEYKTPLFLSRKNCSNTDLPTNIGYTARTNRKSRGHFKTPASPAPAK